MLNTAEEKGKCENCPTKRIVIVNGFAYDKRLLHEVTKKISWDCDILKLAFLGPILWVVMAFFVLILIVLSLIELFQLLKLKGHTYIIPIAFFVIFYFGGLYLYHIESLLKTFWKAVKVFFRCATWKALTYWHAFPSHLSDKDPLVILSNCVTDAKISSVYLDGPYYKNIFVDAIYVRTCDSEKKYVFWYRYINYFLVPAVISFPVLYLVDLSKICQFPLISSMSAYISGILSFLIFLIMLIFWRKPIYFHLDFYKNSAGFSEYNLFLNPDVETKELSRSINGYGIFYISKFFKEIFKGEALKFSIYKNITDESIRKCIGKILKIGIQSANDSGLDIEVCGINTWKITESCGKRAFSKSAFHGEKSSIRLPVKKFIAVCEKQRDDFPFYLHNSWENDELHYLLMGGAEHQQALIDFILHLKEKGYKNIDILENAFANKESIRFASEYFVSAVIKGEEALREKEKFFILRHRMSDNPERWVYSIYGLSAIASKIGFIYWFCEYEQSFKNIKEDMLYSINYVLPIGIDPADLYIDTSWCKCKGNLGTMFLIKKECIKLLKRKGIIGITEMDIRLGMNYAIPQRYNDKVFFYCNELRHDQNEKAWEIYVNPEDYMVALDEEVKKIDKSLEKLPTIIELRKQKPQGFKKDNTISYKGKILFSSGVILIINGKILMLQRSKNTTDPEKWTSPAGRCDLDPELTGLKEFYEELILINKKERKPIFVKIGSDDLSIKEIYKNTLKKKKELGDINISEDNWSRLKIETTTEYRSLLESVTTKFGNTLFKGNFLAYLDEENNTLELRILAELKVDERELENMEFLNGEGKGPCRLFSLDEFVKMDDAKLVPTMIYFRDIISKLARKS